MVMRVKSARCSVIGQADAAVVDRTPAVYGLSVSRDVAWPESWLRCARIAPFS
jgi:hypothetical protein